MKKPIAPMAFVPAMPLILVAVKDEGKINFAPFSMYGQLSHNPPLIYVSLAKGNLTAEMIRKTQRFSINFPGTALLELIQLCGSISGRESDKSKAFEVFYGSNCELPMILECPVNLSCRLYNTLKFEDAVVFIGEVTETFANEDCLVNDRPVAVQVDPLFCTNQGEFHGLGRKL